VNDQSFELPSDSSFSTIVPEGKTLIEVEKYIGQYQQFQNGENYYIRLYVDKQSLRPELKVMPSLLQGRLEYEYTLLNSISNDTTNVLNEESRKLENNRVEGTDTFEKNTAEEKVSKFREINDFNELNLIRVSPKVTWLRLQSSFGFSSVLGSISPDLTPSTRRLVEKLSSGSYFDIEATFFWDENSGLGLYHNRFFSSASGAINLNMFTESIQVENDINFLFYGLNYSYRLFFGNKKRNQIIATAGAGLLSVYDNIESEFNRLEFRSDVLGFNFRKSYDVYIVSNFYLNFNIGYIVAQNNSYRVNDGSTQITLELDESESFSRFEAGLGLIYSF